MSIPDGTARGNGPVGVVLAGGRGRRLGGEKAVVKLCGRPLISYPLAALRAVLPDVVVLAKTDSALPGLPGQMVWRESCPEQHPLVGIRAALERARGRAVLVCAVDLPLITPRLVRRLAGAAGSAETGPAAVASHGGAIQPLLGCYRPEALAPLQAAALDMPVREVVAALGPAPVEVDDPVELFNVNTPADLAQAAALLERRE
jgi:molybdopterin-guanine dinucleotide biosynthesis protein A